MKRHPLTVGFAVRPVCLAIGLLGAAPAGWALPQGGVSTSGQTTVQQVAPGQLTITQGSARASIDWSSFSIAAGETVRVQQPGAGSVLLNRVTGPDPSLIHGSLQSNGSVWLLNPRGIVFGAGSQVDVGSLVASTLAITQEDAASGRLVLGRGAGGAGSIVSDGHIRAASGTVVLAAPRVQQGGTIEARRIGLAAATDVTVDVEGDGLVLFNVRNDGTLDSRLTMQGQLRADGGSAELRAAARAGFADTVLNLEGVVQARSLGLRQGRIVVDGGRDGITRLAGTLDASGYAPGQTGGQVQLTGQNVLLDTQAVVDASGAAGGGRVQVGGGFQGRDTAVPNAERLVVRPGARLAADVTAQGDGGEVILWSDKLTRYHGSLSARGGPLGGDGGLAEVSGKEQLEFWGSSDLGSPLGVAGVLWLDPTSIEIVATGANFTPTLPGTPGDPAIGFEDSPPGTPNNAQILNSVLNGLLNNQTVILQAKNDITVSAPVTEATGSLTLQAGRDIIIGQAVSTKNLTLSANDPGYTPGISDAGKVQITADVSVDTTDGALLITNNGTGGGTHQIGANLSGHAVTITGAVDLTAARTWTVTGQGSATGIISGGSLLTKDGPGTLTLSGANTHSAGTAVSGGVLRLASSAAAGTGSIALAANTTLDITGGATVGNTVTAAGNATLSSSAGNGTLGAGTLTLQADGAALTLSGGAGSTLTVGRTIADVLGTGTESVTASGPGTVVLNTANTHTGGTAVNAGTLRLANAAAAGTGTVAVNGATLELTSGLILTNAVTVSGSALISSSGGATLASGSGLTLADTSTLTLQGTGGELVVARVVDDGVGSASLVTSGAVALTAANSFDGGTSVTGGTLRLANNGAAGTGAIALGTHTLDITGGAAITNALTLGGSATVSNSGGLGTLAGGTLTLADASTLTLRSTGDGLTVTRLLDDAAGTANLNAAAGTVTLTADNTLSGSTAIGSGATLVLGNGAGAGSAGTGAIGNEGTLRINRIGTLTLGSVISGSGGLQQAGAGTTVLAADNTYSGTTSVSGGVLQLGNGGTTGSAGSGTVSNNATLRIDRIDTLTLDRTIAGTGALVQAGTGITVLNASHAYSGGTTVSGGTLRLLAGASAGSAAVTLAGGVLDLANGGSLGNDLVLTGAAVITNSSGFGTLASGTAVALPGASTLTLSGTGDGLTVARTLTDGAGTAAVSTSGTVVLTAANSFDGGTTVTGGTLRLANNNAAGTGAIALGTHTLDITGNAVVTNALTLGGSATVLNSTDAGTLGVGTLTLADASTLTLRSTGTGLTVTRLLDDAAGTANLNAAAGTVTLTADNTLSGSTAIGSGATLVLGNGGATGSLSAGPIAIEGLLRVNRNNGLTLAGTLSGSGSVEQAGAGTTVLASALNSHGGTLISGGVLEIAAAGALGSGNLNFANNATLQVNSSGLVEITRTLSGSGRLSLPGGGTTVLTAANSYSGGTTVSGGTLRLSGSGSAGTGTIALGTATLDLADGASSASALSLSGSATVTNSSGGGTLAAGPALALAPGSTLTLDASGGTGLAVARVLDDGAGTAAVLTRGTVTLSGANTFDGGVTVDGGTLRLGHTSAAGTGTIALGSHTLDLFGSAAVGNALTLGGGASLINSSGAGTLAAGATVVLAGGSTLTLASTGSGLTLARVLDDGTGSAALRATAGTVTLTADNTLDGSTTVDSGATLALGNGGADGTATRGPIVNHGVLRIDRNTALQLDAVISGSGSLRQAGTGSTTLAADNSYSGGTLVSAGALVLGAGGSTGTAGSGTITNNAQLRVNRGNTLALDNVLAGSGSLVKEGAGLLTLRGANSTTGGTVINAGTLEVTDGGGLGLGPVANDGTLRLNLTGALTIAGAIGGSGALVQAGTGTTTLSGASTYTGGTQVNDGRLVLSGAAARAGAGGVLVGAATLDLRNGASIANAVTLDGGTLDNGSGSGVLTGSLTLAAAGTVSSSGGGLTLAGAIGETTAGTTLIKTGSGTVTLAGAGSYTGATQILAGRLDTSAADRISNASALQVAAGAVFATGGSETVASLSGPGSVVLGSGTLTAGGNGITFAGSLSGSGSFTKAGTGTLTFTGAHTLTGATTVAGGTLQLAAAERLSAASALVVNAGATLALAGNQTVASALLRGTLSGSGTLTATTTTTLDGATVTASLGAGALTSTGASLLAGSSAASTLAVTGGTLSLGSAGRLAAAGTVTVASGAALQLAGDETVAGLTLAGTLGGAGTLTATSVALAGGTTGANAHLGAGAFSSTGNSLLGGSSAAASVTVQSGTLTLGAAERLADTAALTVQAGAVLALAGRETVDTLTLAGSLAGAGELVAGRYTLDGGRTAAATALGAGVLISRGNSLLGGRAEAGTLGVETGTLTLGPSARLATGAALDVASGATLLLDGDQTVQGLTLGGVLGGSGTLTAASVALAGGRADAALGAGVLTSTGASQLNDLVGASRLTVSAGQLRIGGAGLLSPAAELIVANGARLTVDGDNSVASLDLAGTIDGAGRLTSASTVLNGGSVGGALLSSTLISRGLSSLGGTSDATTVRVEDGTLTLVGASRFLSRPAITVAPAATLLLGGGETATSLTLAGTLGGSGTLTADRVTLNQALVQAALVTGSLSSQGTSTLAAEARTASLAVDGGTLLLVGGSRLLAAPAVTVAAGATLALGGAETVGTLAGAGTVALGSAVLSTGSGGDSVFDGSFSGAGALVKQGTGRFTLAGLQQHGGLTQVEAGTLALAGPGRLDGGGAVAVSPGATLELAGDERVASLLLQGTLAGSGTLTAPVYTLDGGTARAGLGAGAIDSRGSSLLAATAGASTVTVSSGTLTLAAPDRLADDAAVQVAAGAGLILTGAERIGSLTLSGTLAGGTLSAARYTLAGGTVVAELGSGTLSSVGNSRLEGRAAVTTLHVDSGQLVLAGAARLSAQPAVTVAGGGTLALGGDETLGTLAGAGQVAMGASTLSTGLGGDARFDGRLVGSGGLVKQGNSRFTLTGDQGYTGSTRVDAGTLEIGAGGSSGSLATDRFIVAGTLRLNRADDTVLLLPVSGSGQLEQAGTGRLTLQGRNTTHTGGTRVLSGELLTTGDDLLPDTGTVSVAAGARLVLGGAQTLGALEADGSVELAGALTASGALRLGGAVVARGGVPLRLSAQTINAVSDDNRWGSTLELVAAGPVAISSGRDGGLLRDLVLGRVALGAGGRVDAGTLRLDGDLTLTGGTLTLSAAADAVPVAPTPELVGKNTPINRPIAFAADVVSQGAAGSVDVGPGATLSVLSPQGGSVQLLNPANRVTGQLEVISGGTFAPWSGRDVTSGLSPTGRFSLQSRVQLQGSELRLGGRGIEADVVAVRADRLATAPGAVIAARLPFDNLVGTAGSVPALTLELTPQSFAQSFPFGQRGGNEIAIDVGSRAWGNRSLPIDGGYITVLPRNGAQGVTAVILTGPRVEGSYGFFFEGAGNQTEIPVLYNGVLPITPQVSGSISATLAVSESARRQGFDEAVRTENVAVRLRAGVIAEVGPGRPATVGTEGLRLPSVCEPAGASLACDVAAGRTPR